MDSAIKEYDHPLLFYGLVTALSWSFWGAAGYISHLSPATDLSIGSSSLFGFMGLLAPMAVAFWLIRKKSKIRDDVLHRVINFKEINPIYLWLALFLMPGSILLAQAVSLAFGYSASQFVITGHFTFSSGVFPVWFLLIMAPILEELGWRTYGTDCLRSKLNLFNTSMLFAFYWGIWHIPLSFINNYYQSNLVETGWIYSVNFLVSIFPFVIIMNWLYYKSGRNIFIPIIFHITAGYFNEIFATHPDSKIIQTVLLLMLAVFIVINEKQFFFSKKLNAA